LPPAPEDAMPDPSTMTSALATFVTGAARALEPSPQTTPSPDRTDR
jgi:hypothetical protein